MHGLEIGECVLDGNCEVLRQEVRAFLAESLASQTTEQKMLSWTGVDFEFSRKLGARGWIGMTWPKCYGGHERSAIERYVVTEELLAAGAPCGGHWTADRQHGPMLLRFGSEELKSTFLPRIVRGELATAIGMSEPDSGSDLASIRTKAERVADGWVINGRKIWSSGSLQFPYMVALVRTGERGEDRHGGLSQFWVDLKAPGITIRPVQFLTGEPKWGEVTFDNVFVRSDYLLGEPGNGWGQVTTELGYERSGPDRYLSSLHLLLEMLDSANPDDPRHAAVLGKLVAELSTLRQLSLGIAGILSRGENPGLASSIVKDLGTTFEQQIPESAHELFDAALVDPDSSLAAMMNYLVQLSPSFSIRGGTREVLRGIIARGLGIR